MSSKRMPTSVREDDLAFISAVAASSGLSPAWIRRAVIHGFAQRNRIPQRPIDQDEIQLKHALEAYYADRVLEDGS